MAFTKPESPSLNQEARMQLAVQRFNEDPTQSSRQLAYLLDLLLLSLGHRLRGRQSSKIYHQKS